MNVCTSRVYDFPRASARTAAWPKTAHRARSPDEPAPAPAIPKLGPTQGSNTKKDPDEWVTGDEPMTGAQASYLKTLCSEAGEEFDPKLTKAAASKRIDELQALTGRGQKKGQADRN